MGLLFGRYPRIDFYIPEADSVSLSIEGQSRPVPMRTDGLGNWSTKLPRTRSQLNGLTYHFEVRKGDQVAILADPLAQRTERRGDRVVSFFTSEFSVDWQLRRFRAPAMRDLVIYESHLPALSRHPSAQVVDEKHRGTYLGACAASVLNHLQQLNLAIEFMPLHASDHLLGQDWGYFSTSFRALTARYAVVPQRANREFLSLVRAFHARGLPVLLDVVFNHGGELIAKAWGEDLVYRRHEDGNFCHGSGCGPTIRTEHPIVRKTIIDTLLEFVHKYRIDGFRFDLGALHDMETMLEIDRRLPKQIYLISEPWALGGAHWGKGDMCGAFAHSRWAVWNDDFRAPAQRFINASGDFQNRDRMMRAIAGSHVADGGWACNPQQCINYLTSHDGKTLADLVYGDKQRAFLGTLLVLTSQGVPMLYEGSELMYSKAGEHNSYNRPDLNQIDWQLARANRDLVAAVAGLVELRKKFSHFRYTQRLKARHNNDDDWDIDWIYPTGYPHQDSVNAIGYVIREPREGWFSTRRRSQVCIVLLNGEKAGVEFVLPKGQWQTLVDGHRLVVDCRGLVDVPAAQGSYFLHPGCGVVLTQENRFRR